MNSSYEQLHRCGGLHLTSASGSYQVIVQRGLTTRMTRCGIATGRTTTNIDREAWKICQRPRAPTAQRQMTTLLFSTHHDVVVHNPRPPDVVPGLEPALQQREEDASRNQQERQLQNLYDRRSANAHTVHTLRGKPSRILRKERPEASFTVTSTAVSATTSKQL